MRNLFLSLPYWARLLGYKLEGNLGTYGEMFLYKNSETIKKWSGGDKVPNIFELEDFIVEIEGKKVMQGCKITH